ncbi:hypothetical protein PRZ48_001956 [Zasmidium cellare]|uniref:Uncharacterized protein n=1 Tax=Zasmidium cellare TaxID=395010 RepID=A0ABR0F418_ZASCE|nr:hypothetical protein PRZ48_001956 [Zasmidium cellare]
MEKQWKESLLDNQDELSESEPRPAFRRQKRNHIVTIGNIVLFVASITALVLAQTKRPTTQAALKATNIYTPFLDEVKVDLILINLNGSLWTDDSRDIWRRVPNNEESEDLWTDFEMIKPIVLSSEQVRRLGKNPKSVVKFDDEYWHFGDDAYIGALDLFHQVHCLDELRKKVFEDYDGVKEQGTKHSSLYWAHLRHCTGMLMQHLLCTADAGFLTYDWMEDAEKPFPDMGVNRRCRDWKQLVEYRDRHGVDREMFEKYTKPKGAVEVKQPPEYWGYLREIGEIR